MEELSTQLSVPTTVDATCVVYFYSQPGSLTASGKIWLTTWQITRAEKSAAPCKNIRFNLIRSRAHRCRTHTVSKQADYFATIVNIDSRCTRHFWQARHGHDVPTNHHDKLGTRC